MNVDGGRWEFAALALPLMPPGIGKARELVLPTVDDGVEKAVLKVDDRDVVVVAGLGAIPTPMPDIPLIAVE